MTRTVRRRGVTALAIALLTLGAGAVQARAAAMVVDVNCNSNTLAANDDSSTGLVPMGFTLNFFGVSRSSTFVNNNGNVTFDSALGTFTPFNLNTTNREILAPFFGDVDTRASDDGGPPTDLVQYGQTTFAGRPAFCVNWGQPTGSGNGVGFFSRNTVNTNRIQLMIVNRDDIAAGDADIYFNYDQIQWETGQASGSDQFGRGGSCARVGYANGTGNPGTSFELNGSAQCGAFLDSGTPPPPASNTNTRLTTNSLNSPVPGQYLFQFRAGTPSVDGRMVSNATRSGATFASIVDCDASKANQPPLRPFQVKFGSNTFKVTNYSQVVCTDDPNVNQAPAAQNPNMDTQNGSAAGTLNGAGGHSVTWKFVDAGVNSPNDGASMTIRDPANNVILNMPFGPLSSGQIYSMNPNR